MATPCVSSAVQFVKNYPITLCGFSLLFMPSVYRLLFYFTPLLISTAIFIVAMMSWGPAKPSQSGMRRGKHNDWAFSGSLKIYGDDEEDEGEGDDEEVQEVAAEASFLKRKVSEGQEKEDSPLEGKPIHVKLDTANEQEPDTDSVEKKGGTAMASKGSVSQAEPDPDLDEDSVGAGSYSFGSPDFMRDELIGAVAPSDCKCCCSAGTKLDPALHADDCVQAGTGQASHDREEDDPGEMHAGQQIAQLEAAGFSPSKLLQALPAAGPANFHHTKLAAANPDQPAAPAGHNQTYHDAEDDHLRFHDAQASCLIGGDGIAEPEDLDYHEAEQLDHLLREPAVHAKSKARHLGNEMAVPTEQSELQQIAGKINRAPYKGDRHDSLAHQLAERLQTLQAAA